MCGERDGDCAYYPSQRLAESAVFPFEGMEKGFGAFGDEDDSKGGGKTELEGDAPQVGGADDEDEYGGCGDRVDGNALAVDHSSYLNK